MVLYSFASRRICQYRGCRAYSRGEAGRNAKDPAEIIQRGLLKEKAGDGLLSRHLSVAVPSALQGLTAVFGMGTGVAPAR